jgi:hypothetical protein
MWYRYIVLTDCTSKDKLGEEALVKISRVEFSPVAVHNCT